MWQLLMKWAFHALVFARLAAATSSSHTTKVWKDTRRRRRRSFKKRETNTFWGVVGLKVQREGQHRLSPLQLMCGMGAPSVSRCCQPRQTAALGSAPDLTETSPSISHIIWVSEGVCAPLAVTLTRRHKLFLSRCSLMHSSLIPPPYSNTKTNTRPPCSNYTCARILVRMRHRAFHWETCKCQTMGDAPSLPTTTTPHPLHPACCYSCCFLVFSFTLEWVGVGWVYVHSDSDCCWDAKRRRRKRITV